MAVRVVIEKIRLHCKNEQVNVNLRHFFDRSACVTLPSRAFV